MSGFVPKCESIAMMLISLKKSIVDNACMSFRGDIFGTIQLRAKDRYFVRIFENCHAKKHTIMRQILIILCHAEIILYKSLHIYRTGFLKDIRLKIFNETISYKIEFRFLQKRNTVALNP